MDFNKNFPDKCFFIIFQNTYTGPYIEIIVLKRCFMYASAVQLTYTESLLFGKLPEKLYCFGTYVNPVIGGWPLIIPIKL